MEQLIQENICLKEYNSWKVGGSAELFCLPATVEEIRSCYSWANNKNKAVTILGDGSNSLISDKGIAGLVICLKNFSGIERTEIVDGRLQVQAKAGTSKMLLMREFLKAKLSPALFLAGLPGNLAGGIVMNAGVSESREPKEFGEIVDWIEVLKTDKKDLPLLRLQKNEIDWAYRHTQGWQPGVIVSAQLSWSNEPVIDIPKQVVEANKLRKSKQPLDLPSCGSTFKNPVGTSAGQLIDECGLKGYTVGGAQVSEKHANFIVNINNATATDVATIIQHVQSTVKQKTGIMLNHEVRLLGSW